MIEGTPNPYAAPIVDPGAPGADAVSALTPEEIAAFAGKNGGYYAYRWARHGQGPGLWKGFNWAAAIFTSFWFAYRRMYLEAVVVTAAGSMLDLATNLTAALLKVNIHWGLAAILTAVPVGVLGNGLYHRRALAAARVVRRQVHPDGQQQALAAQGGTSGLAVVVCLALSVAFASLFASVAERLGAPGFDDGW